MKTIMVYEVNGKRFDDLEEAKAYEVICENVDEIVCILLPRTKEVDEGADCLKQDVDFLKTCFRSFCFLCSRVIPDWKDWFTQVANGDRHFSHIGRILSDYSDDFPVLWSTYCRFCCIDFENGYEFQQPYFVTHQEEFFEYMKKQLEYKNNGN